MPQSFDRTSALSIKAELIQIMSANRAIIDEVHAMGIYLNPGNDAFSEIADSDYVDMTGLIELINRSIGKKNKLTCVCRPRRFGKSWEARMLAAYYDCTCDSHELFDGREIARSESYARYLNQFNVIYLDISGFVSGARREGTSLREIPSIIIRSLQKELGSKEPGRLKESLMQDDSLEEQLISCVENDKRQFVFIIDEWDALIREAKDDEEAQKRYLNLLRGLFKNKNFTPKVVAAAYITGILPIKKDGTQSAISDFREFSMLNPGPFARFTGFQENEVKVLCRKRRDRNG